MKTRGCFSALRMRFSAQTPGEDMKSLTLVYSFLSKKLTQLSSVICKNSFFSGVKAVVKP